MRTHGGLAKSAWQRAEGKRIMYTNENVPFIYFKGQGPDPKMGSGWQVRVARKLIAPEDVAWRAGYPGRWSRVERYSLAGSSMLGVSLGPNAEFGEGGGAAARQ